MPELEDINVYLDLLPILVVLIFSHRIKVIPIWVIFIYSLYSFINNQVIIYKDDHHLPLTYNLQYFTLFEYLCFATMFYFILRNKLARQILIGATILFTVYCLYSIHLGNFKTFDSMQTSIESIIVIACSIYFLAEQIFNPQIEFIYTSYKFWIVVGMLIYLAGAFFVFSFAAELDQNEREQFWKIMFVCSIIKNLLFTIAIWLSVSSTHKENKKLSI